MRLLADTGPTSCMHRSRVGTGRGRGLKRQKMEEHKWYQSIWEVGDPGS